MGILGFTAMFQVLGLCVALRVNWGKAINTLAGTWAGSSGLEWVLWTSWARESSVKGMFLGRADLFCPLGVGCVDGVLEHWTL